MAGDDKTDLSDATNKPRKSELHPAYSVTNVQTKIRTLDGTKVTYSSWIKLFRLHATAYQVLGHIDNSPPPAADSPEFTSWKELDALVLQWIYSTVSDDLLVRILETESTARHAWTKLEKIFLSNKKARAGALETKFCNLTLSACTSLDDYCQKLKDLANQLEDVGHPVTEERLVLQLVRGLPAEYDTTASLINANNADWDLARSMLHDEVIRLEARQKSTNSVLLAQSNTTPSNPQTPSYNHQQQQNQSQQQPNQTQYYRGGRSRGRGRSYRGGRGRGSGRGQYNSNSSWTPQNTSYPQWAWWNTPPCPYPTQPTFRPNTPYSQPNNTHQSAHYAAQFFSPETQQPGYTTVPSAPYPPGFGPQQTPQHTPTNQPGYNALNPSDIGAAMSAMHLNYPDPNTIMDTGASAHASDDSGPSHWTPAFTPQ